MSLNTNKIKYTDCCFYAVTIKCTYNINMEYKHFEPLNIQEYNKQLF